MTREEQIIEAAEKATYQEPPQYSELVHKARKVMCAYEVGFIDGCVWADSHPHWIPVEERLPETIDWYLCYNDLEDGCEVLHWEGDGNVWMDNDWHYKDKEVTHWMPLPQAPRNEDKK